MKKLIRLGICALLFAFGAERILDSRLLYAASAKGGKTKSKQSAAPRKSGKKTTAKQALDGARKAFAATIKAAKADKGLDPATPKNKPFWQATKKIGTQLKRAQAGLAAKNDDFFKGVSDARAAEEQMKVAWQLTDSKNQRVIDNAKKLGRALAVLRTDFSKEAARKKKGGTLTAKEKESFAKLKAQQVALLKKINALQAKAKTDKALQHGLKKIAANAQKIVKAPETVNAFVSTLYLFDEIEGWLFGYDYYIDADWRADWVNVDTLTKEWEVVYTDIEVSETYEWSQAEESVELYTSDEFEVSENISEEEIQAEETWDESQSVEMTDAEEAQVAQEEDTGAEVEADNSDDSDSMEDASDDDGQDFDGDGQDDSEDDDGGGDNDGGGEDDSGGDDGGSDDDGGGDDGGGE